MQEPGTVTEYLDALARELRFDAALSRRVRKEVGDHLCESIADHPGADPGDAQRRAIAGFGDPREIARQYAATSLFARTRRVGFIAILALIGIYIAMKGRGAWYGLTHWGLSGHLKAVAGTWISLDLGAFRVALAVGIVGLGYIASRRAPISLHAAYRRQAKRCVAFCAATAGALLASVMTDAVITALHLFETQVSAIALVPVLSIAGEIALLGALVIYVCTTTRRIALAAALL